MDLDQMMTDVAADGMIDHFQTAYELTNCAAALAQSEIEKLLRIKSQEGENAPND